MVSTIIGIIMILSFLGMIYYCVKGYNLMIGFFVMSVLWVAMAFIGNAAEPSAAMKDITWVDVLSNVFQAGPENYGKAILVNIFFGAFFGRVLMDTGIAATLIRKTVELGGDRPRITMTLLCIITAIIFTSMTGIGPVISIAVIILPIMLSLGIPSPVALFAFMGSIMAGVFINVVNLKQYLAIVATANESYAQYTYNEYFSFAIVAGGVSLLAVLIVSNLAVGKKKKSHAWASAARNRVSDDAPAISWVSVILPVVLVLALKLPIILAFITASLYALITCRKLSGGFPAICRMLAKMFSDGAIDVAPMVGFLLTLSMFSNAANFAAPYFGSIIGSFIPTSPLLLCIMFGVLAALGHFRGPMNLVGCGAAILPVIVAAADWPIQFLYPLFAITTIAPQHLDITQSWVAWGLGYTKVNSKEYMKMAIPTSWAVCIILCAAVYVMYGGLAG